jgi:threonine/homoserine/homoserine lactone efflux protein
MAGGERCRRQDPNLGAVRKLPLDLPIFVQGLILGFSIAAPVGPIGVLCIRRTLAEGRAAGLVSGLGAATADALYGSIAGFGLTLVSGLLIAQQTWLKLLGGTFLLYLGIRTFIAAPKEQPAASNTRGLFSAYTSTLFLTLTNPLTILSFTAIFAGLGIAAKGSYLTAAILVSGVFAGSALWWLLLSSGVSIIRSRFREREMRWINRLSGVIISVFGILVFLSFLSDS